MPSFDVVCKVDMQEVDNALNSVRREILQRYDFKDSNVEITIEENNITILAGDDYKLGQIEDMLKIHFTRRKIDPKVLEFNKAEKATGMQLRQKVTIKQGIDTDTAKNLVKEIKNSKIKVQASIRSDELRIEGKKRDDLQEAITLLKNIKIQLPLQFINFRD